MEDEDCITEMFEYLNKYRGKLEGLHEDFKRKNAENELKLNSHNGSSFDGCNILNILSTLCRKELIVIINCKKPILVFASFPPHKAYFD